MMLLLIIRKPKMIPTSESLQIKRHLLIESGVWGGMRSLLLTKCHRPPCSLLRVDSRNRLAPPPLICPMNEKRSFAAMPGGMTLQKACHIL